MTTKPPKKTPLVIFALYALMLNGNRALDNSHFLDGDPFQPPRRAAEIATSTNSREYGSLEQKLRAPLMTVTTNISSDGPVPSWDITSGQLH